MQQLTLSNLKAQIVIFIQNLNSTNIPELFGVTDGKAVGTYVERQFNNHLRDTFVWEQGNSANGIDFPSLNTDIKVTSVNQPQSSCPFRSAEQKVYGLGYHLLVCVYNKKDDTTLQVTRLQFGYIIYIHKDQTADYQTSLGLINLLSRNANLDDIIAFLDERNLPLDEIGKGILAERILKEPPKQGYLTVSNALQWRLQYGRAIEFATQNSIPGIENLLLL